MFHDVWNHEFVVSGLNLIDNTVFEVGLFDIILTRELSHADLTWQKLF